MPESNPMERISSKVKPKSESNQRTPERERETSPGGAGGRGFDGDYLKGRRLSSSRTLEFSRGGLAWPGRAEITTATESRRRSPRLNQNQNQNVEKLVGGGSDGRELRRRRRERVREAMAWGRANGGVYEPLDGGTYADSDTTSHSEASSSGQEDPRCLVDRDGVPGTDALMLTMKHRYIRKFLHLVLFPTKVAKYSASYLHGLMSEVYVVVQLTVELSRTMAAVPGKKWVVMFFRLLVYSALLMPGFVQVAFFYFFSSRVRRSVVYGPNPRNRCDLYLPPGSDPPRNLPVAIFVTGGAWIIGYKAWGCLFGKVLSKEGVLVVSLDYRNFPQGRIQEMLEDVDVGIGWVLRNIHKHGGDPNNVCLVGQSAGAHLSSLALLECAERCVLPRGRNGSKASPLGSPPTGWSPTQIKAFVGVSGAYDMLRLSDHLNDRGLHLSLLNSIMSINGRTCLEDISPASRVFTYVEDPAKYKSVVDCLPPVTLLHGKDDDSIPYEHAEEFGHVLERAGVEVDRVFHDGETHTTPLIENPMRGHGDRLSEGVLSVIKPEQVSNVDKNNRRMVPEPLIRLALRVSPF